MESFKISKELLDSLFQYLSAKPFNEVANIIIALDNEVKAQLSETK